ncbi:PNGase F N-terminal domain-containing protein [Lutimonas halocynthiae]|uniref:PNGase F N-terminal domain-containing protein n=1 Tax=Lutimonas halocynthiae TaxID=1446477 RepID=UPI0025B4099D|nr:PNGase F N-terminal domain-containing protein [Lutimonas halocynthiae]MDN3644367.1 PNGase F N-terminal domain-containing protein [Lutimonas halocynthiae]
MRYVIIVFIFSISFFSSTAYSQNGLDQVVFKNQPVNYEGTISADSAVVSLQKGRLVYKKVEVPNFPDGTDVKIRLSLRSEGDRWDKTGSCFVVADPKLISILDIAEGNKKFPMESGIDGAFLGVRKTNDYEPVIELVRFITPFGVGHYSKEQNSHRKPVYIPEWEKEVVWETDISHLLKVVTNHFYIGVWIDSWTKEGYRIDLSLHYSNRPDKLVHVKTLLNTVSYIEGQSLPDFFADGMLEQDFSFDTAVKNVKLYYITSGHGGHSGGDEFSKRSNRLKIDKRTVLDFIPWRDDCASFRRFNPSSGVWLKKDSASYIDFEAKKYRVKEIEERIASSDLSRSNWCPGSIVEPVIVELGDMSAGGHKLTLEIDASAAEKDKYNHWLVSAYLTYEE